MDMDRTKRTASKPRSGLVGGSRAQGQPVVSAGGAVLVLGGVVALARLAAGGFQVGVDDGGNVVALPHDLAFLQPDHPVAARLDLGQVVRYQEDRARLLAQLDDPLVTLGAEVR